MKNYCINRAFQLSVFYTSCFSLKKKSKKKSRTHGETRHSRDRQGRVSVRRLGLVYTGGGVERDLQGTRVPGVPRVFKKEPQRKKDNALNCIILFQISRETG